MQVNTGDTWHVIPLGDLREHDEDEACWCTPAIEYVGVGTLVTHNAMDDRESYEQGRKLH